MGWKQAVARHIFDRYFAWRLDQISDGQIISLEYRFDPEPRYGYGKPPHPELYQFFESSRPTFSSWIARINEQSEKFAEIEKNVPNPANEPTFRNTYFLGLDAAALYTIISTKKPARIIEVGSGNSTKFAHRAKRDHGLGTRIVSVDPYPRAEVETLCDESIRMPLESVDLQLFQGLQANDVLFIDNSHRCFTNSDVSVFFLEILPRLRAGVILHLHDIFLPYDYPPEWRKRYYSEQYLLASWLLAKSSRFELMLSNAFVSLDAELSAELSPLWNLPAFSEAADWAKRIMGDFKGYSFWAVMRADDGPTG